MAARRPGAMIPVRVTRRAAIRTGVTAAVSAAIGVITGGSATSRRRARTWPAAVRPAAQRRVLPENLLPGDPDWWIKHRGAPDAVQGYASRASVLPGEQFTLHVSTTAAGFRVTALRMGWYRGDLARQVWESGHVTGRRQRGPSFAEHTRTVSCGWEPSLTISTDGWPEGSYLLRLDAESGAQRYVPLTVRSASTAGKVVIKNAVTTWQAYNAWGGYDLYKGPGGYQDRSLVVSLDRPFDHDGAYLFMVYERKLINLVERLGLPVAYVSSTDIEADPHLLDGAAALISPGHDEYWSVPERRSVTAARDSGMNLAFLGANAMFRRIRTEASPLGAGRRVVCYKTSYLLDPMYGKDNALVTTDWREAPHPHPESSLTGTLYESYPVTAGYVVASPHAWVFAGTGVRKGTRFRGLVGTEYDRVNPRYPVQRPIEILSHSPLTCRGVNSYADSAYYTHAGGAGVFNAGTMRWVQSLARPRGPRLTRHCSAFTTQVTTNVLRAFADGPAAAKFPARDNLESMHEWPGDPIAGQHNLWPPAVL